MSYALFILSACGGGTSDGSTKQPTSPQYKEYQGVVQKGPFEINTVVELSQLDSVGIPTGNTIQTKVNDNKGHFNFEIPDDWNIGESNFIKIMAEGFYFNEITGKKTDKKSLVSSISNDPNLNSVNLISHWSAKRTEALLQQGKALEDALQQSKEELSKIFGIGNSHQLDISQDQTFIEDNALLLLLSGSLMEVAKQHASNPQQIIDEIATDFADDGKLSELGDDWFIRMQAKIRDNPSEHIDNYAKALKTKRDLEATTREDLPEVIKQVMRPSAILPEELTVEPGETIILDGRESHGNPIEDARSLINYTWFRVDKQAYNIPFSDRFIANPSITVPNEEAELLFALVVTDEYKGSKDTDTAVIKVIVKKPPTANTPPIADSQISEGGVFTNEDTSIAITLTGSDLDNNSLTFVMASRPLLLAHGMIDGTPPNLTYYPDSNFFGSDESFIFHVNDGFADSNKATVEITVASVNDAPVADAGDDFTYITPVGYEGGGYTLKGVGTDPDDDILIYHWKLVEPFSTYNSTIVDEDKADSAFYFSYGQHVLSFTVTDPQGESDSDTMIVDIKGSPSARYRTFVIGINGAVTEVVLRGNDPDGDNDTLVYEIMSLPENGTLQIDNVDVVMGDIVGKTLVYKPNNSNVPEADSFTYRVRDVQGISSPVKTVDLTASVVVNLPPTAGPVSVVWGSSNDVELDLFGNETVITLFGTDPEGSALTYKITSLPEPGFLSKIAPPVHDGSVLNEEFNTQKFIYGLGESPLDEPDKFTFIVIDDQGNESEPYTVDVPLQPLEAKIRGGDRTINKTFDGEVYTSSFEIDGSGSTVPLGGVFVWEIEYVQPIPSITSPPSLSYDANKHNSTLNIFAGFDVSGEYKVTLTVTNGLHTGAHMDSASIFVKVSSPPVATSYLETSSEHNFHIDLGDEASFAINSSGFNLGSDPDGDSFIFELIPNSVAHDSVLDTGNDLKFSLGTNGVVTMTPPAGKGNISFKFKVIDQYGFSSSTANFEMLYLTGN